VRVDPVSRRYATALHEIAEQHDRVDAVAESLRELKKALDETPEFRRLIQSHRMKSAEKAKVFRSLFSDKLETFVVNTIATLLLNQRYSLVDEIPQAFEQVFREHQNIASVLATTAVPLTSGLREQIMKSLEEKLHQKIELTEQVDASLIGGIRLQIDNKVYDGTAVHQLEELHRRLS